MHEWRLYTERSNCGVCTCVCVCVCVKCVCEVCGVGVCVCVHTRRSPLVPSHI